MAKIWSSSHGIRQWQCVRMREEKEPNSSMAEAPWLSCTRDGGVWCNFLLVVLHKN